MSSVIRINSINGTPPYVVYACDFYENNCNYITTLSGAVIPPIDIVLTSGYTNVPVVLIKIIDSTGCVTKNTEICSPLPTVTNTPTPTNTPTQSLTPGLSPSATPNVTPTVTPTNTQTSSLTPSITKTSTSTSTPTQTPSNTATPTQTPSVTRTQTQTPSVTRTQTQTPTVTTTNTTTPTMTPSVTQPPLLAYLFIEPVTASTEFNQWMLSGGSTFRGFSNGIAPSTTQSTFESEINRYIQYSGWSIDVPAIRTAQVPTTSGSVDFYGNAISAYQFKTHEVPAGTETGFAWYTWIISTAVTNGQKMSQVGINSLGNPNSLTNTNMNSTYYDLSFTYTGGTGIPNSTYRVYTTYIAPNMRLNGINNIYFKGGSLI